MNTDKLRAVFGLLTDMAFDIARLDTLTRQKPDHRGFMLELTERACVGIEGEVEDEFRRLAKMLGFKVEKIGAEEGEDTRRDVAA